MNKTDLITAIMNETDGFKKTHLAAKPKDELETIYVGLTATADDATQPDNKDVVAQDAAAPVTADSGAAPVEDTAPADDAAQAEDVALDEREAQLIVIIPTLADYSGVESEMVARPWLQKLEDLHNCPHNVGRKVFRSLIKKGYVTKKGRADGQHFSTFKLTDTGIQYLADNDLLDNTAQVESVA